MDSSVVSECRNGWGFFYVKGETVQDKDHTTTLRRKDVKAAARLVVRANPVTCIIVSILGAAFIWPVTNLSSVIATSHDVLLSLFRALGWTRAEETLATIQAMIARLQAMTSVGVDSTSGVIATVYNSIHNSGGIGKALLYSLGHVLFRQDLSSSVIAVGTFILSTTVFLFLRVPLRISSDRIYLETRIYPGTPLSRLLFVFRRRRTWAIGMAGLYKIIWLGLWSLTVVMFPVKYYSYLMFDYILAENPHASAREALKLSQRMMKGNKMRAFLLDLSFLPWYLLGLITFGMVVFFYANPYRSVSFAEFYVRVRYNAAAAYCPGMEICDDRYLVDPAPEPSDDVGDLSEVYPDANRDTTNSLVVSRSRKGSRGDSAEYPDRHPGTAHFASHSDYRRTYSATNLILFFFCFSFIGWAYESVLSMAYFGRFINKGTLYGPWIPIYGTGGVLVLLLLKKIRDRPVLTFFAAMAVCGIVEYLTATVIYDVSGLAYWSYQGYFFNIQGRVCLEGLLVFGMGCTAIIYFLAPLLDTWLNMIPMRIRHWIIVVLAAAFLTDAAWTLAYPRTGFGLTN